MKAPAQSLFSDEDEHELTSTVPVGHVCITAEALHSGITE
jgi:hypothetical protein